MSADTGLEYRKEWSSVLQGTATIIDNMHEWKQESEFASFMDEREIYTRIPPASQILNPDRDLYVLDYAIKALRPLELYLNSKDEQLSRLHELISFVEGLYSHVPVNGAEEQFEILQPLRNWLFFGPIDFLRREGEQRQDPSAMVLLAHYCGVALAVEPIFPAVGASYFGTMSLGPIEYIHSMLMASSSQPEAQHALGMMAYPLEMAHRFGERMDWKRGLAAAGTISTIPRALHPSHLEGWDFNAFPE